MNKLIWPTESGSTSSSSYSLNDISIGKMDSAIRFNRVQDMMRMFTSPSVGSRRYTSVIVERHDHNLLTYGNYAVENSEEPKRTSTRMTNFVNAMRIIYGARDSLSPASFMRWRRKLLNWIKLSTLEKRAARVSQFIYTVDPRTTKPENRFQMQKIREHLWNELKAHEFCLNNFIEQEKLCKRLEAVKKKRMRKEVKELAHKEYLRVHSLINWGPLTHEELACLHDQYSTEPPKRVTLQTTEKQGKKVAPYMHIPKVKTKSPSYHNISHLEETMKEKLKQLNEKTPEVKQHLYRILKERPGSPSDPLHQMIEELLGPPTATPTDIESVSRLSQSGRPTQGSETKSFTGTNIYSSEDGFFETDEVGHGPETTTKIPLRPRLSNPGKWDDEVYENESIQYLYDQAEILFPNLRYLNREAPESHQ
ncbi:hypothetical protein FBUS_07769 [Fasciolopsis buskii]|uniref:Uncharacterized protein n=1 Tax=Fasciolopsis buskii TaxID=27845 RepID=A0A8E0VKN2_9TREM|nr:hypothetical protein FBUS_07769 [Fasciolopsis buski]